MTRTEYRTRRNIDLAVAVFAAARWALIAIVILAALAILCLGCGSSHESASGNWVVQVSAPDDLLAQTRAWEICGGTVICTYSRRGVESSVAGFWGLDNADVVACYQQHGAYASITRDETRPLQCSEPQ